MTEIATIDRTTDSLAQQAQDAMQTRAVSRLAEWAHAASAAYEVARGLVDTSFVPSQFRGKPHEATAAILAGAEVGLSPMSALKSFDVIQGTAAPRAITLRAILQSQGHQIVIDEQTATRCVARGKRRGTDEWQKVVWTIDRARDLQLLAKDNWKKQPQAMLVARATSELARLIAADAILGIGYSIEELSDDPSITASTTVAEQPAEGEAASTGTRKMSRKPKAKVTELVEEVAPGDEPMMTKPQQGKIFALLSELGVESDEQRRAGASQVLGRDVQSFTTITKAEAIRLIESLEQAVGTQQPTQPDDEVVQGELMPDEINAEAP